MILHCTLMIVQRICTAFNNGRMILGFICNFIDCCLFTHSGRKLLVAWLTNDLRIKSHVLCCLVVIKTLLLSCYCDYFYLHYCYVTNTTTWSGIIFWWQSADQISSLSKTFTFKKCSGFLNSR